ncbi:MAG: hypothetical protein ACUZ8O_15830, partial [Candidatus Anammoxibacter sp.]
KLKKVSSSCASGVPPDALSLPAKTKQDLCPESDSRDTGKLRQPRLPRAGELPSVHDIFL